MLQTLMTMFITFTLEMLVAGVMLIKHPLRFRFKPYIAIPVALVIAFGTTFGVIFGLNAYLTPDLNRWNAFINILSYTIPVIGIFFAFFFAYKISVPQLLLMLSVAYTFQSTAYQCVTLILDTGLRTAEWNSVVSDIANYAIKICIYAACYFLIARTYKKYSKYILNTINIIVMGVILYLVINVANVYISQNISVWKWYYDNNTENWVTYVDKNAAILRGILAATLIFFCVFFDMLVVGGFRIVEHRQETMIIKATLNSKVREQEMMENNINFINMKCHDLRKELRRLKAKKGNLTDEDFSLLEESLNFYDSSVKTGNVNIDALIQEKLIYCNSVNIEFTSLVDGEAFGEMSSSDIYFLLVNIIDNAIEAAESFEEKEKRVISLTASRKQGLLFIEETNYYQGEISFNKDGSIRTTKENKKYHGYGTKSIAYIVKKYGGKMEYDIKDKIFKLRIVI